MQSLYQRINQHRIHYLTLCVVAIVAAFLRFHMLQTHAAFTPEIGRELVSIQQTLGVKSVSATALVLAYAFLGFLAVVALYELLVTTVSNRAAVIGAAVLAVSPLAVAQSRMAYHSSPIVLLFIGYLWALSKLWQQYSHKWLAITLGMYLLVLMSEHSSVFLIGLLGFVLWKRTQLSRLRISRKSLLRILVVATVLVTAGTALIYFSEYFPGRAELQEIPVRNERSLLFYLRHALGLQAVVQVLGWLVVVIGSLTAVRLWRDSQLSTLHQLATVSLLLLSVPLVVPHVFFGQTSEAYFSLVVVTLSILTSAAAFARKRAQRVGVYLVIICMVITTTFGTYQAEFFTTDRFALQYDALGEHRAIAASIFAHSTGAQTFITSTPSITAVEPDFAAGVTFFYSKLGGSVTAEYLATTKSYLIVPLDTPNPAGSFLLQEFRTKKLLVLPARVGER